MKPDKARQLLLDWCDYLLKQQITDEADQHFGGFRCEACDRIHGRADNAVFPLVCAYALTGEEQYLDGARRLLRFRRLLAHEDGSVQNDFDSEWKGITVFSALNLSKTLAYFGEKLPADLREELKQLFAASAEWVYQNVKIGFRANINYYCAAAAVNAMAGAHFGSQACTERAKELLAYGMAQFTNSGLIGGEGQPHGFRTKKGCAPVDVGYAMEESLPCLIDAATALQDGAALDHLRRYARRALDFLLPDGGWDNSFGVRNNKWTYYGSRTADGCLGAFAALGKTDAVFAEAARRTVDLLRACTRDGALHGGLHYQEYGQPPCVHHTFCHAAALADALCRGLTESKPATLPCDAPTTWVRHYPELDTYKLSVGPWLATVTAYDYITYTFPRGAAHASGGSLSLLYHRKRGAVIAGSVYEYKLTEPNNMQQPQNVTHRSLIPRAEYEKDGVAYTTCLDGGAAMEVTQKQDSVCVSVQARFCDATERAVANERLAAFFRYTFTANKVTITAKLNQKKDGVRFVLPIVKDTMSVTADAPHQCQEIFFLTGGFGADEYVFSLTEQEIQIEIGEKDHE